jgi:hypothetical protein
MPLIDTIKYLTLRDCTPDCPDELAVWVLPTDPAEVGVRVLEDSKSTTVFLSMADAGRLAEWLAAAGAGAWREARALREAIGESNQ